MREDRFFVFLLLGHLLLCLLCFFLLNSKRVSVPKVVFGLVILVPYWGTIAFFMTHVTIKQGKMGARELDLNRFDQEAQIFSRPFIDQEMEAQAVIPLEEAMMMEDPSIRRKLMKDLVQEDPRHFVPVLQWGRLSDDTEVSHYASAAIMQIQTEYEMTLQKWESILRKDKTEDYLEGYILQLQNYIKSGLLPRNAQFSQRWNLKRKLEDYLELNPLNKDMYLLAIDNALELQEMQEAKRLIAEVKRRFREDEAIFLMQLKYHFQEQDGVALEAEIKRFQAMNLYLTPEAREKITFWEH